MAISVDLQWFGRAGVSGSERGDEEDWGNRDQRAMIVFVSRIDVFFIKGW